ncbi:DNA polymerase III subunit gamma/tau [Spiroplasma turonicum]|uniref:DNA polymerase III subunit gamma/tau n=1 Tax=Spiroplasma turonicum TaxID=216946 RepID=A0A0K1P5Q5_9MOLU|nr:DNA polymerase III subunit gamma/tau [Spiroplasma turonicum]AKU79252.1 DNA polymerase III subunits gamma and tau [Spiroplasma turonicum]ALX70275.1 DNA polymerase III subunits gamma and tau [Spiroplasma turonicum]
MDNKKTLYRRYRPSNFNDLVGHDTVKDILESQLKKRSITHAMIFAGQRGTGKTSLARIFAKVIQCKKPINDIDPCNNCNSCNEFNRESHPDFFEIDAASNNGIDEIRSIKANITTLPALSKYKVYIIDEVHMLSNSAFNALLKTLEEPPKHVIFILATTEQNKIPPTIISRCHVYNFNKLNLYDMKKKLIEVSTLEGYTLNEEVANEIFYISDGSLRDALNYLEQCMTVSENVITIDKLKKLFYVSSKLEKINLLINVFKKNIDYVITMINDFDKKGIDFSIFLLGLLEILKEIIEYKICNNKLYLKVLEEEEAKNFLSFHTSSIIQLTDLLTEAYVKTKNTSIGVQIILLQITKFHFNKLISVNSEASPLQYEKKDLNDKTLVEQNKKQNIKETDKSNAHVSENVFNNKTILSLDDDKKDYQLKELLRNNINNDINVYFDNSKVINELINANKEKRLLIENKLNDFFSLLDLENDLSNILIPLYSSKVVASSNECAIFVLDNITLTNWIINKLEINEIRDKIFNFFEIQFLIPITKEQWIHIKTEFMDLKNQNKLPTYIKQDYNSFSYKKTKLSDDKEDKFLNDVKEHFNDFDIEVEK